MAPFSNPTRLKSPPVHVSDAVLAQLSDLIPHRENVLWAGVAGECNGTYALHVVRRAGATAGATTARDGDISVMIGNLDMTSLSSWMSRSVSHVNMLYVPHILIGPDIAAPAAAAVMAANSGALNPNVFLSPALAAINEAVTAAARRASLATSCTSLRLLAMHAFVANNGRLPATSADFYRSVAESAAPWALSLRKATRDHDDFSAANFQVHALPDPRSLPAVTLTPPAWPRIDWGVDTAPHQPSVAAPVRPSAPEARGVVQPSVVGAAEDEGHPEAPQEKTREELIAERVVLWTGRLTRLSNEHRPPQLPGGEARRTVVQSVDRVLRSMSS